MSSLEKVFLGIACFMTIQIDTSFQQQVDLTLEPLSTGYDVSLSVVRKLYRSAIFEDDFFFVHRVAHVGSNFGENPTTFQENVDARGIWQLTEFQFNKTQNNNLNLTQFVQQIPNKFPEVGSWDSVTWEDLLKPLHNGLAFRLFLETLPKIFQNTDYLPSLLVDQADFYHKFINPQLNSQFIEKTLEFEGSPKCSTEMDIVFVQDGSCTVYPDNFTDTLNLFVGLVNSFAFDNIRVGHVVYSNDVLSNFALDNDFTQDQLVEKLLNASRPDNKYTETGMGIQEGLKLLQSASPRANGVAKVIVSITDGASIDDLDAISNQTLAAGVNTFAFGLAFGWTQSQLLTVAHNLTAHIIKNGFTFNLIPEALFRSNMEICSVPFNLGLNETVNATVGREINDKRFYKFDLSLISRNNSLNVTLGVTAGEIKSFYSYSEDRPSAAINDGQLILGVNSIPNLEEFTFVFIAVEGIQLVNSYNIKT